MTSKASPNFAYLAYHDERLVALGTQAEEHFAGDPTVALFKLRQFAEVLAQRAAARVGLLLRGEEGLQQLIDRLWERNVIGATQRTLFHDLRRIGNAAVHEGKGDHAEALHQLRTNRNSRSPAFAHTHCAKAQPNSPVPHRPRRTEMSSAVPCRRSGPEDETMIASSKHATR